MRAVFVDGVNKGEIVKRNGRWCWYRGNGPQTEIFPRHFNLADIAAWACRCCNGKTAKVKHIHKG